MIAHKLLLRYNRIEMTWSGLVDYLIQNSTLKTPSIIQAFNKLDRKNFMPDKIKYLSDKDAALPIGYGQTISQPTTVALMLELLQPEPGQKILDIGSGSGWTTALLAEIVGPKGKIFAVELIPQLVEFGKKNVKNLGYTNVEFILGNGSLGLKEQAPFDRILCSAAAPKIPLSLKKQLASRGRLVIPVGTLSQSLVLVKKGQNSDFSEEHYPGFVFVQLKGKYGF